MAEKHQDDYSPDEIAARLLRGVRRALATPRQTQKPKPKRRGRPRKRVLKPADDSTRISPLPDDRSRFSDLGGDCQGKDGTQIWTQGTIA